MREEGVIIGAVLIVIGVIMMWTPFCFIGLFLLIGGIFALITGIVTASKKEPDTYLAYPPYPPQYQTQRRSQYYMQQTASGKRITRYCTNCGRWIPPDSIFCPYCGHKG